MIGYLKVRHNFQALLNIRLNEEGAIYNSLNIRQESPSILRTIIKFEV